MKGINSFSILMVCVVLASCKADMICPAYQSYFLIDKGAQRDQFGYFALDSLPRRDVFYSSLDKNGLVAKTSLFAYVDQDWVRNREIRTVNMEVIYPILSDSLLFAGDVMMYAETDIVDSTALDSARMAAQTFRYGADQKYYNWYFRDKLVWKDELDDGKQDEPEAKVDAVEKAGFFAFFKNLFKKKEKPLVDEEGGVAAEDLTEDKPEKKQKPPKQKKEKKKKKQNALPDKPEQSSPAKEEDDGEDDF